MRDPYTGRKLTWRRDGYRIQIDHVYPLSTAWYAGAWAVDPAEAGPLRQRRRPRAGRHLGPGQPGQGELDPVGVAAPAGGLPLHVRADLPQGRRPLRAVRHRGRRRDHAGPRRGLLTHPGRPGPGWPGPDAHRGQLGHLGPAGGPRCTSRTGPQIPCPRRPYRADRGCRSRAVARDEVACARGRPRAEADLRVLAADEVGNRRTTGRFHLSRGEPEEIAVRLVTSLMPDEAHRVDEELVWLRLQIEGPAAVAPIEDPDGPLWARYQIAERGFVHTPRHGTANDTTDGETERDRASRRINAGPDGRATDPARPGGDRDTASGPRAPRARAGR